MLFPTNANQVQAFAGALYGVQVGSVTMAQVTSDISSGGGLNAVLNRYYSASFGSMTTTAVATSFATNLGLTGEALAEGIAYTTARLNAVSADARGAEISAILNLFSTLTADATFGAAATAWTTKVTTAAAYTGTTNVAIGTVVVPDAAGGIFALSAGTDNLPGTAGNDTFNAVIQAAGATGTTIQPGDVVNGGAGIDTLSIAVAGDLAADFTLSAVQTNSVEKVLLNNFDTGADNNIVDTSLMSGLNTVGLNSSSATGDTIFSNMTAIVGAEMRNGAGDLTLTYAAAAVAGTADTQALTVSNLSAGTFTANGAETIAITTELVKSTLTNVASNTLKTVTAAGAVDLTIGTALTATTINAAAMTGALNVKLGAADQAVTGGAGADIIDAGTNLTSADTIVGGDGVDTLKISISAATAVGTAAAKGALFNVSGVEVIDVASTNDAAAVDLNNTVGVTTVVAAANVKTVDFAGSTVGNAAVTFVLNGVTVTTAATGGNTVATAATAVANAISLISGFTAVADTAVVTITATSGEAVEVATFGGAVSGTAPTISAYSDVSFTNLTGQAVDIFSADAVTASLKDASGTADALTINLATVAADKGFNHAIGTVTANNIETINLSATGMTDGKIKTIGSLAASGIKTLNITGESDLTISGFGTQAATIDGSTATGDLNLTVSTANQSIKTGSGNDTINMAGTLTAADTIDGGGNNAIAGGTTVGKDKLTASGNFGTITAAAALKIANVETIEITNTGAAATFIDATGITGAESIAFSAASGTVNVTNLAAGTTIGLAIAADEFDGTLDLTLADATGAADAISLAYGTGADTASTVVVKVAAAVETLNIAATTESGNADTFTITNTDMAAKNIVVTSGHAADTLALGTLNAATTNVNASAYAGILTMAGATATAMTVSANGAVANNITTGTGVDIITLAGNLGIAINTINAGTGTSVDVLNVNLSSPASDFTSVTNVETINMTIAGNVQAGFGDATKDDGLNLATNINLLGGDALSTFTVSTAVIDDAEKIIDATGFAGAIDLTLAVNALDADMTIKGGALLTDKVTTSVSTDTTGEVVKLMTGVETLVLNSVTTDANARIDLTNVSGLVNLQANFITGATLSQIAVDKLMSGVAIKATGTITNDNLVIDLADKAAADNALALEIGGVAVANDILNIDAAGVETLNIKASNTLAATLDLAGVAATATAGTVTVNVTGAGGVIFKTLSALTNVVNASTATGAITLASADRAATAMTITTGTAADTVAMRHANDVLNGGLGTDTLTINANLVLGGILVDLSSTTDQVGSFNGNANAAVQVGFENVDLSGITGSFGADITARALGSTITGTANADQITGGAGADTVVATAGNDAVSLGGGNDTIRFTTALLSANEQSSATYDGGDGTDTIEITDAGTSVIDADFRGMTSLEVIKLANGTNTIVLGSNAAAAGITTIIGGTGADTMTPGDGPQTITTGGGADVINFGLGHSGTAAGNGVDFDTITSNLTIGGATTGVLKLAGALAGTGTAIAAFTEAQAFTSASTFKTAVLDALLVAELDGTYEAAIVTVSGGTGDGAAFNGVYFIASGGTANVAFGADDYIVKLTGTLTGTLHTDFFDFV